MSTPSTTPSPAPFEVWLRELEANLERLAERLNRLEHAFGGYGKGYVRALDIWRVLLKEVAILNRSMHVLMNWHAQIKSFQDPDLASAYDRYQLKINDKAAALVRKAADGVLLPND